MNRILFTFFILISCLSVSAIEVDRLVISMNSQKSTREAIRLINSGSEPEAISLSVAERVEDEWGRETRIPSDDFIVFPEQVIVMPNTTKKVLIQTAENFTRIESEKSYRLIVQPHAVDLSSEKDVATEVKAGLNIMKGYVLSLYVAPPKAKPDITVTTVKRVLDNNARALEFHFLNEGTEHIVFKKYEVQLRDGKKKIKLNESDFPKMTNDNLLAGNRRIIRIPVPEELSEKNELSASIKLK